MGVTDGGISGIGYACGCWSFADGRMEFCGKNPSHKAHQCGCYNIGGKYVSCRKHTAIARVIATAIVVSTGIALWISFSSS